MAVMAAHSTHLGIRIDRPAAEVYDYVCQPVNLPNWAAGLGSTIELIEDRWVADSPLGRVEVAMAEPNPYGVDRRDFLQPDAGDRRWRRLRIGLHNAPAAGCERHRLRP